MKEQLEKLDLVSALKEVANVYSEKVVFSTSFGQEDQVILDAIFKNKIPIEIFTLDTGRLFAETYELMDKTRNRYKSTFKSYFPDALQVEQMQLEKGFNSFYESVENRKECCSIRKIQPLKRALANKRVWITGIRAEQSENRESMQIWEHDKGFDIIKFNPLLSWTMNEVENYLLTNNVPQNTLHKNGFVSIGCQPCTRAIVDGEHPRAGRWWWEESKKECGLHETK